MERKRRVPPQQRLAADLVRRMPEADRVTMEAYGDLARVASELIANQQAFWSRYDLSEGKYRVVELLRQAPEHRLTPSALAEAAGVTRGTMTGLISGLERSGLVERTQHPEDGRMCYIALTGQAEELFERVLPERISRILRFMSALSAEEQHQLSALLDKVENNLPALCTT